MRKLLLFSALAFLLPPLFAEVHLGAPLLPHQPLQLIVKVEGEFPLAKGIKSEVLFTDKSKRQINGQQLLLLNFPNNEALEQFSHELEGNDSVLWVQPNYVVPEDPRERVEISWNDPLAKDQVHHQLMQTEKAFELTRGSKDVVLALTDDGIEYTHSDLQGNLWMNPDELENGIDDDGNGLIDDIRGWDFSSDDNSILPEVDGGHGTHLAGIILAQENNGEGVVGAAPGITLMPLKFYGGPNSFTSAIVAKTFAYAMEKGAKIISTSYGTDWFVGDRVYEEMVEYAYAQGVILFHSAGNNRQENPPRLTNDLIVFVAATNTLNKVDRKTSFSNYGYGVDIAAPGEAIYSTYLGNSYRAESGTSMATPLAASTAALIWSYYPDYNFKQVIARLLATTDSIDEQNTNFRYKMGVGRVNSWRALSEEVPPPVLKGIEGLEFNPKLKKPTSLRLILKNILESDAQSGVNHPEAFELTNDKTGEKIPFTSRSFHQLLSNKIDFNFATLSVGHYTFRARAKYLVDPFGHELDGNGDGIEGDDYILPFEVISSYSY